LNNRGNNGYYWSSSEGTSSSNARYLYFNSGGASAYYHYRLYGFLRPLHLSIQHKPEQRGVSGICPADFSFIQP
jgi:hypothetical protein